MKRKLLTVAAAALCGLTSGLALSNDGIDDPQRLPYYEVAKDKKVVFVPLSMGFDLTETWAAVMQRQANELGYTIDIRDPNWSTDAGAQALTQVISEKPDLIVAHNPDVQVYARLLQRAQKAGIPVLQINMKSAFPTEGFVGPDWVHLGEKLANIAVEKCSPANGGSGKIAITQGPLTAAASAYQMRGVANVVSQHSDIQIVSNQAADWDASKARTVTATAVQQHPDLCAVIGFWDGMDIGTGAALEESGLAEQVTVITSGAGTTTACENLKQGVFDVYVNYDAKGQGRDLNTLIMNIFQADLEAGAVKASLFSPLTEIYADTIKPDSCYDLEALQAAAKS